MKSTIAMALAAVASTAGPFDIPMFNTPAAPTAHASARLTFAPSPFGVAVTADGRASYDVTIVAAGLPAPETLGQFHAYVAWAVTPNLAQWRRLGAIDNGTTTVGGIEFNKFLLVVTAAADSGTASHAGPTVLHGTSPSGWLQTFLSHPLFRGIPWGG